MIGFIRKWARRLRRDVLVLWFAFKHPDVPLWSKAICLLAILYALSPIDLIPDVVPLLGIMDDVILVPALLWLTVRTLPSHVLEECKRRADDWIAAQVVRSKKVGIAMTLIFVCLLFYLCWRWFAH